MNGESHCFSGKKIAMVGGLDALAPHIKKYIEESGGEFPRKCGRIPLASKMDFFYNCKELCEDGRSILLAASSHTFEKKAISRIYAVSDYYLRLRSEDAIVEAGMVDERVIKILQVLKLNGAECQAIGTVKFEIKPKVGIQILPFTRIRV